MSGLAWALLAVYAVVSGTFLVADARSMTGLRVATKPLLMASLLAFYLVAAPHINLLIVLALVFSLAGDTLLLSSKTVWFVLGGIGFLLAHITYVCAFAADIQAARLTPWVALIVVPYVVATVWLLRKVRPGVGKMKAPTIAYLATLDLMGIAAFLRFWSTGSMPALVTFIGSLVFLVSDFWLTHDRYCPRTRYGDVVVMLTYCAGQLLIVGGYVLT